MIFAVFSFSRKRGGRLFLLCSGRGGKNEGVWKMKKFLGNVFTF